jgi:ribosomal protein L31
MASEESTVTRYRFHTRLGQAFVKAMEKGIFIYPKRNMLFKCETCSEFHRMKDRCKCGRCHKCHPLPPGVQTVRDISEVACQQFQRRNEK